MRSSWRAVPSQKKAVSGEKCFYNALVIRPLGSNAFHKSVLSHFNGDIQSEIDRGYDQVLFACGSRRCNYSLCRHVPHGPDAA